MKNKTSKTFRAVYFVCIINCILLSAFLLSDVWARYFSEATDSDSERVAKWDVTAKFTGESTALSLSEEEATVSFPYSITNNSEVVISYDILLTLPESISLPNDVTFAVGNAVAKQTGYNVYCIQNIEMLSPLCGEQNREIKITATNFSDGIDLSQIQVNVIVSQVD